MKNNRNKMTLRFLSRSSNESFARAAAAAFIAQLDPTVEEISDIKTSVSEAVTNSIVHAYRDRVGEIVMTVWIDDLGNAEIIIKDRGCGIPDVMLARTPMYSTGGSDRSGMGFTIMESFMDKLSVKSTVGKGTTVKMRKRIARRTDND